jgi:hypothetical protein
MKKFNVFNSLILVVMFLMASFLAVYSVTRVSYAATLPDLVEMSVKGFPAYAETGSSFSVQDTVKNIGGQVANKSVTRYYLSTDTEKSSEDILLSGSRQIPKLQPNGSSTGKGKVTVPNTVPSGLYYLIACADDTEQIVEGNELNNCTASASQINLVTGFTGTYTFNEQYNNNIEDGLSSLSQKQQTIKITRHNATQLVVQGNNGTKTVSLPLVQNGNMVTLTTHPYTTTTSHQLELILMSDGNNMVMAHTGQELNDSADISLIVANWIKNQTTVTVDDFVGTWDCNGYDNPNLEDTTINKGQFGSVEKSVDISKVDDNTVSVNVAGLDSLSLQVLDGRATLTNAPVVGSSAIYYALSIVTDGTGLSAYMVTTALNDPTIVFVGILLGTKQ